MCRDPTIKTPEEAPQVRALRTGNHGQALPGELIISHGPDPIEREAHRRRRRTGVPFGKDVPGQTQHRDQTRPEEPADAPRFHTLMHFLRRCYQVMRSIQAKKRRLGASG